MRDGYGYTRARDDADAEAQPREDEADPPALACEHPAAAMEPTMAAGLALGLDGEAWTLARLTRQMRRGMVGAAAGAAILLDRVRADFPAAEAEPEVDEIGWLIRAEDALAFPGLPASVAEAWVAGLWERIAAEARAPRELCLAGDRVVRLAHSHPQTLAPAVARLLAAWPVLAGADGRVGAQVAWTAARTGAQRLTGALEAAVEDGASRTVAEDFAKAALAFDVASGPPLSHGEPSRPSAVYYHWPRDVDRREAPHPDERPRKDPPGPVHLGAAAPHSVRPRNRFLAYFAAYTDTYADWVQERLMQEMQPDELRLNKKHANWKDGTRIVVVPVSEALEFDPPQAEFTWNGRFEIQEFACTVRDGATLGSNVLEFQVNARVPDGGSVQFEKVRVGLGIVENAPLRTRRLVTRPMATTAFISYATADRELVSYKLSPLRPLGIQVYDWRLNAVEGEGIKEAIEPEIRGRDVFFLFWSRNARASEWVRWELEVALDAERSGRPRIIPQLLENLDEMEDFPARLHGRQFFNPFFLLDRPEHVQALVEDIAEPALAPAGPQPDPGDADGLGESAGEWRSIRIW